MIATGPTPLWYATRSTGYVSLLLLTAILVLGITTSVRWGNRDWPRFVSQALHRNLSLLVLVFLLIHVVTVVLDPFASISVLNAVAPFSGSYRPIWLGLGVVSLELLVALTVTSLLRQRIGFRTWRVVHWLAYACWPTAILHTLGTGSDVRSVWAVFITMVCIGTVFAAIAWRLVGQPGRVSLPGRLLWMSMSVAATVAVLGFAVAGPLQSGWARAAGTPTQLLAASGGAAPASAVPTLPQNLSDPVSGALLQRSANVEADLTDTRDPSLRVTLIVSRSGTGGTIAISQDGVMVCNAAAVVEDAVTAECGATTVTLTLSQQPDGSLGGQLVTAAASQ